jgi:hypothetical protein
MLFSGVKYSTFYKILLLPKCIKIYSPLIIFFLLSINVFPSISHHPSQSSYFPILCPNLHISMKEST